MTVGTEIISHSLVINASAETLYDMVADVTRMGAWSRACTGATWDEGSGPEATENAWFTGHNLMGGRSYDTHCQITAAERPATIAWVQGGAQEGVAEWRYRFTPIDLGTEVTESWTLLRPFPADRVTDDQINTMHRAFDTGIRETLLRLKSEVENS